MAGESKSSFFKRVDLNCKSNNEEHHTNEISEDQLIVRRGQPFKVTVNLTESFKPQLHPFSMVAQTGSEPSQDQGTMSFFSVPDGVKRSRAAKAIWKVELNKFSSLRTGAVRVIITPPANAPVGEYQLSATYRKEEKELAKMVVLFNPWCPDDSVFLSDDEQRQEYVMNEQGIIYKGSGNYINSLHWDFGQFEDNMVKICMDLLNVSNKHQEDPAADASARCDPIYVGRVISAMINSQDDHGVLVGRWEDTFPDGVRPWHWNGSHDILNQWLHTKHKPVKYGQCWVFAGVMCSVMRLLGIPCRVVTNFESAHDNNSNLTIDMYHADYGVKEKESHDSIWNFHVWVEGWMKRPDLAEDGKFDGWQVLDPTPQEMSDGVYCCGPAPVKAILNGETHLQYDVPFVFAEVNADCVDWLVKADGTHVKIWSDSKRVGYNISTKSVGSNKRKNITNTYKHKEGSDKERAVFKYACTRDYSRGDEYDEEADEDFSMEDYEYDEAEEMEMEMETDAVAAVPPPPVTLQFKEMAKPINGKDVKVKLVLHNESSVTRPLSINISTQAMRYNGLPAVNIQTEVKKGTLQSGTDLSFPIVVPFSAYHKHMVNCDSIKISAVVMDKQNPDNPYLAEDDIVLQDPPISVTVSGPARVNREVSGEVVFKNPANETLKNCTLTLSGSGLWKEAVENKIADMKPSSQIRFPFVFVPYKIGKRTLVVDFDCASFRDIKGRCSVDVKP